jgi:predicted ATP-grasp superfamily ATP-dependent carboligase
MVYVEFKRDPRDGKLKLIECNPRFTGANELLARSGLDYSWVAYADMTGRHVPPMRPYRRGVRLLRPLEDLLAFREYRRRGELSTLGWVRTLLHPYCTPTFAWSDPWPSMAHLAQQVSYQVRKRIPGKGVTRQKSMDA